MDDGVGDERERTEVPRRLVVASEIAARVMVVALAVGLTLWALTYIGFVVAPVIIAMFVTALLEPVRRRLISWGMRQHRASVLAFVIGVVLITGVVVSAVGQFYSDFDDLTEQASAGIDRITTWFETGPLALDAQGVQDAADSAIESIKENPGRVVSGAFSVLSTTGALLAGGLLAFITTLFFVTDRPRIYQGVSRVFPQRRRPRAQQAMVAAWEVLVAYVKVTLTEAVLCAVVIGTASALIGLPISFTLAVVVFLLGFIPTIGAVLSGAIVVLVALVTEGATQAVVLALIVLVVQQVDANIIYPLLTSRRLAIHPLASLLLVTTGAVAGGLFGAFLAVPVTTMLIAARASWIGDEELTQLAPPPA